MLSAASVSSLVEAVSGRDMAADMERVPKGATSLLLATDACCQAEHVIVEVERGGGEMPIVVCITCIERWGRKEGLRRWQERCPDSFLDAYPRGLTDLDLGITARPRPAVGETTSGNVRTG